MVEGKDNYSRNKIELNEKEFLDFEDNPKKTLEWSNRNVPNSYNHLYNKEDLDSIKEINESLRQKYLNRSELYEPFNKLEIIDRSFIT